MGKREKETGDRSREFQFFPRIINPVRIKSAVLFAADARVRDTDKVLEKNMPWLSARVLPDPFSVSNYQTDQATAFVFDDTAINLVETINIKQNNKNAAIILLTSNDFIQCSPPSIAAQKFPYSSKADLVFACNSSDCASDNIIVSVVRAAEDLLNITRYSKARRYIFLLVDDEPRWFSQFLPVLYHIIGQRADVMLSRTFEQALKFLFGVESESEIDEATFKSQGYGDDVVCLITDIFFPKGDELNSTAGKDLIRLTRKYYPRIPIIIASKTKEAEAFKDESIFLLPKGDPGSLETLRKHIRDNTGIGKFIILNKQGRELFRVKNIAGMMDVLKQAEGDGPEADELRRILESHGSKDNFSTWLYMHSFRELADELRPKRASGKWLITLLKRYLSREMLRMSCTPLIIEGKKIFDLRDLVAVLKSIDPAKLQEFSDNDIFSSWLDRKGYSELADELRPIHGSGAKLMEMVAGTIERRMREQNVDD
jgi:hypothetical protein